MGIGNYYAQAILDYLFGGTTFVLPSTYYAALFSAAPSDTGGGTELAGSGYSRVAITNNSTNFPASTVISSVATKDTGLSITWGPASGTWATATYAGFYDAPSSGNLVAWGPLSVARTVLTGQSLLVTSGGGVFTQV